MRTRIRVLLLLSDHVRVVYAKVQSRTRRMADKPNWAHLVGKTGEEAKEEILKENKDLKVEIMPPNSMATMDYRTDRVRIQVDENGKVSQPPRNG
eukprot:m.17674 g.17674  ORF g.17674 m.17674 type:complete len:95 (+) comp27534_c0_seq1:468-752(+)